MVGPWRRLASGGARRSGPHGQARCTGLGWHATRRALASRGGEHDDQSPPRSTRSARRRIAVSALTRPSIADLDRRPETELNFKFYRQATNKIVGISDEAAAFLDGFF